MTQARMARKSGRNKRNPPERARGATGHPEEEQAAIVEAVIDQNESANDAVSGSEDQRPMLPVLMPQRLPAMIEQPSPASSNDTPMSKLKFSTGVQALLISAGLTAVLIFSFGALKAHRGDTQLTAANASASLAVPASDASIASSAHTASITHPVRTQSTSAGKSAKAGMLKKSAHVRTDHAMHAPADQAKKKSTAIAAKAPRKPLGDHSVPLLAQNNIVKPNSTQEQYAQCEVMSSFFRREQCKWQVCGGKWGQDGCPSYQSENREIN